MIVLPPKPAGSIINIENNFNNVTLSWKNPSGSIIKYGIAIFLMAWLGGWIMGEYSVFQQITSGEEFKPFLIFWMVGWTVGGFFAIFQLFNILRPVRPEKIIFDTTSLFIQKGTSPIKIYWQGSKEDKKSVAESFNSLRQKSKYKIEKNQIGKIQIDHLLGRPRLTLDLGAERIEIGEFLGEPEREWIQQILLNWKGN